MSKNIGHIQHVKSNVVENGQPKLPTSSVLAEGELAINYAKGYETISLLNSESGITRFSSDDYYTLLKLGSAFTDANSANTVTSVIRNNEHVIAAALNDLDSKKMDISAYTPTDLSNYYTKSETSGRTEISSALGAKVNSQTFITHTADTNVHVTSEDRENWDAKADESWVNEKLGSAFTGTNSGVTVTEYIEANELVISAALNDLNSRKMDISAYTPTDLSNYYTKSETSGKTELENAFDDKADVSWVEEKLGSGFTGENSANTVTSVIKDNEQVIASAFNDLNERKLDASAYTPTDLSGYYTKQEIDEDKLGSGFTGENSGKTVTQAINETEMVVAASLNDLNGRKLDASAYTPTDLSGYYTKQEIDNDKLGSGFTGENSGKTVTQAINESEIVTSAALTDLDERKLDASAYTPTDLSDYATKEWIEDDVLGSGFTGEYSGKSVTEVIEENELIIASALNDLDERIIDIENNQLTPSSFKTINNQSIVGSGNIDIQGGGGDENALSGVSVNGTAASVSNKVANITSVPASIVATSSTLNFVSSSEKSTWDGKQDALSNASVLTGITSQKVTNWDNAATSAHSHSNKSVIDGITSQKVTNWDNAATSAHSHSNKSALDNLTQTVIDNSHTHSNKTALDAITTTKTAQWDSAISGVSFNGTDATVTNNKAAITATIPTSLSQLTSAHTHAISEVTNLQSTLDAKVSGITVNNGTKVTPTNGVANLTINASTVGALATGTTLDGIADGTTRKLSDYATTGSVNTHSGTTIPSATSSQMHLPAVTAADNGKILMVVNGQWALVNPTTIYTGSGTPQSGTGNDGDIYLQTS